MKRDNKVNFKIIFTRSHLFILHEYAPNKNLDFVFNNKQYDVKFYTVKYANNEMPGTGDFTLL